MKVLIANWIYNSGSTGFIVRDLRKGLELNGHEVISITGTPGNNNSNEAILISHDVERTFYRRLTRLGWPYFRGSRRSAKQCIKIIEENKPDIVHLHLLGAHCVDLFFLLKYLGNHSIPTVLTNHAEVYYTGCCEHAYSCTEWINNQCKKCNDVRRATGAVICGSPHRNWTIMHDAISAFTKNALVLTAVSPWLQERVKESEMLGHFECFSVGNGVDTSIFYLRGKKKFESPVLNSDYILYVTALFDPSSKDQVKGGAALLSLAKLMPYMAFVVVSISSEKDIILPENVHLLGRAKSQDELAYFYSNARLTLITSRRETFSMVTAESLCCGTPVVGFKAGGPESIALKHYSSFVDYGDIKALKNCIERMIVKDYDRYEISQEAASIYSKMAMTKGYIEVYNYLLNKK